MRTTIFVLLFSLPFILAEPSALYAGDAPFKWSPEEFEAVREPVFAPVIIPPPPTLTPSCPTAPANSASSAWITFVVQTDTPNQKSIFDLRSAPDLKTYFDGTARSPADQNTGGELYVENLTDIEKILLFFSPSFAPPGSSATAVDQFMDKQVSPSRFPVRTVSMTYDSIPTRRGVFVHEIDRREIEETFRSFTGRPDGVKEGRLFVQFCASSTDSGGTVHRSDQKFVIDIWDQYDGVQYIYTLPGSDVAGPSLRSEAPSGREFRLSP